MSIVLKEAYRYQNYLQRLINEARGYLIKPDFTTTTKQIHHKSKANPGDEDETQVVDKPYDVEFTPNDIINFILDAIVEKESLSKAIEEAKKKADIDLDASGAMNKVKQEYVNILGFLEKVKSKKNTKTGTAYKFNVNGDQVPYYYDIEEDVTIDYDRNKVKRLIKKLRKETDQVSQDMDKALVTIEVEYTPIWDVDTPLEDVITPEQTE